MTLRNPLPLRLAAAAVLVAGLAMSAAAGQQASPPQSAPASSSSSSQQPTANPNGSRLDEFAPPSANANQELAHASNEAAGEDETAAFKYSPAIRGIAKITGLSLVTAYWICIVINFAIIAVLIILGLKSSLPAMFRGRTQSIQKGMEDARRSSEDAQRRLGDIESRLSRMNIEIDEMQAKAQADARAEEQRMRTAIQQEKQKILESAEQEVEQVASAARRELQKYAASLAIELAEKGIRVDAGEDKLLVEDFTAQLASQASRNGGS